MAELSGPLSRGSALVYHLLVVQLLLLVTTLPGLAAAVLLDRDASNLPLLALCALPVGPALSAALYTLAHRHTDLADLHPAAVFRRAYRANLAGTLRVWGPALAWLTVIAVDLAHRSAAAVPVGWTAFMVGLAVAVALWTANALVITALFTFRTRDVARLALHFLVRTPGVTLGTAALLALAVLLTTVVSEGGLALAGALFTFAWLGVARGMVDVIGQEFVA
jgi:hypothetical protein